MNYDQLALNMLSEHLGKPITMAEIATESYSFEAEELDSSIVPLDYQAIIADYHFVMTHLFAYDHLIVYIIEPYDESAANQILIGLLEENNLLNYHIIKGGR